MANPQIENGFTKLSNELIEALARTRIPGEAMQVLWVIIRQTYGWGKKEDFISLTQISKATGLKRQYVNRAIQRLIEMNIVTKNGDNFVNKYMFNKDFEKWQIVTKKDYNTNCNQKRLQGVTKKDYKTVTKKDTYKRKKETITKKIYSDNIRLTKDEYQKLIDKFGKNKTDWMIEKLSNYKASHGRRYKSDYRAILSWVVDECIKKFGLLSTEPRRIAGTDRQPVWMALGYLNEAAYLKDCEKKDNKTIKEKIGESLND